MDDVFAHYQAALRSGHQLAAEGRFKDALARYEEAAKLAERPLPLNGMGGMYMRLGRSKEALAAYERALSLEPDNLDALSGRAAALLAVGRRTEAHEAQQALTTLRESPLTADAVPPELRTPLTRAETLAIAGEQARDFGQRDAAIDAFLAEAREHAADEKHDAALDAGMRALALDTGSTRVHLALTRLYFERGWEAEAIQRAGALRRLLQLAPDEEISSGLDQLEREISGSATNG